MEKLIKKDKKKDMTSAQRVEYMTTEPIPRLVGAMAVPTIISMLVTSFYNMADTMFVGKIDTQATGAVGIVFSVMALIQACGFFFGHGSGNYISRKLGEKEFEDAERMAACGFFFAIIAGVLFMAVGLIFVDPISYLLGSTKTIHPYTVKYLSIIFVGAPFMMASLVVNNQMRFQGCASSAMVGIISGALLNIVLDPVLMFGFQMGISGAALATVISQCVSFCLLIYMNYKHGSIRIRFCNFKPSFYYMQSIFKGGVPSLCRQGLGSIATMMLNKAAGGFGGIYADAAIAAMGVVSRVAMFANSALIGFGQGFQPVCGTNYGAKRYDRVMEAFRFCVKVGAVVLLGISIAGFLFAPWIVGLFRDDADVIRIGTVALRFHTVVFPLNAWIVMSNMMLQTIGKSLKASILASARQGLFFLPLIVILPRIFGLLGVQMCQMVADLFTLALSVPITVSVLREMKKIEEDGKEHGKDLCDYGEKL